jgi:hypothetical protein
MTGARAREIVIECHARAFLKMMCSQVAPDEASAAGDEYVHSFRNNEVA